MRKAFLFILIAAAGITLTACAKPEKIYPRATIVTSIENNTVTCKDSAGFIWTFTGSEDWMIGDGCNLMLKANSTKEIADDEIISATYFVLENLK